MHRQAGSVPGKARKDVLLRIKKLLIYRDTGVYGFYRVPATSSRSGKFCKATFKNVCDFEGKTAFSDKQF